jgi:signal transduction histidine kinase
MRKALAALVDRRTWSELLYALIGLPLAIVGFVFVVVSFGLSVGLAITVIGILLLAVAVAAARGFGGAYRGLGRGLLGIDVEKPLVDRRRPGLRGYITERNGWRAILFLVLRLPLAILDFTVAVAFWSYGVGGVSYPLWWHLVKQGHPGAYRHGVQIAPHVFLDTPARILAVLVVGVILLLIAPWAVRSVVSIDRALIRGLLGPTASSKRIRALEHTRAIAVDDSVTSLRRIERDLHDGAQARLVSLAMSLGLAKEELAKEGIHSDDPEVALARVRELVDSAHREAKGTIVDLRDLARGIHPPALDRGLPDALATLTARCSIPTTLHIELADRPSPAIETIVYFCTAELLTNVVKHSGAHHASVDVRTIGGYLFVRAGDDGAGGAATGRSGGSGLAGLADRVATVDGRLDIASPEGGPTLITIQIPI